MIFARNNPCYTEEQIQDFITVQKISASGLIDVSLVTEVARYMRMLGGGLAHKGLPQPEWNEFQNMWMEWDKLVDSFPGLREKVLGRL